MLPHSLVFIILEKPHQTFIYLYKEHSAVIVNNIKVIKKRKRLGFWLKIVINFIIGNLRIALRAFIIEVHNILTLYPCNHFHRIQNMFLYIE